MRELEKISQIYTAEKAINLGADYCFLEASESGLSVYQKLGFKPLFKKIIITLIQRGRIESDYSLSQH